MSILTAWRWSVAKWWQLKMMTIENECFNCMKMVSCKVMTIENDDNWKLGSVGVLGPLWGDMECRGVRVVLGADRDNLGTQGTDRGIGASGGIGFLGVYGGYYGDDRSVLGAGRDSRYSGARRGIGGIRGHWGPLGDVEGLFWGASGGVRGCIGRLAGTVGIQQPEGV